MRSVTRSALIYFGIKIAVDWLKHFYLTQMNKLNIQFYSGLRNDIYRKLYYWPLKNQQKVEDEKIKYTYNSASCSSAQDETASPDQQTDKEVSQAMTK